ncbi:Small glutamine-rich tetratricopeptide repeat-containing protein A, putative [Perkinsus marinus ATCC 50983]|uniref:Small glutamine-rich tetratricopeptide repeat-containing protein A, putative n=1 Tax=Perkinsus marinus (strain ATCC 50983 / TXsc) TaxID=423536 RepID=C5K873_PERM5|nr:Small glutamine-rich tetratricopeptide repeat-containing protein A, putative [Perkinsus marinus ATCC 50983]EER19343.1 Small glutamine-rich tetratricopeptide repeat-containing protein A, putative [Perkinsus marinus ATCC 50983]|eukprot:XP_002787547.1 Small glutamine-rich tetratricopeptide repeat-containing protein A, putative [Perkinsus marinus ATCC 50983]
MQRFGRDQLPVMDAGESTSTKPSAEKDIAESQKDLGNDAFKECDFMQAVVFYTNALDHDSTMAVALSNRAQCWLKLGDFEKAESDALKAAQLEGATDRIKAKSWFRAGMARHGRGDFSGACECLSKAQEIDRKNPQIDHAFKMAEFKMRQSKPKWSSQ